MVATRSRLQLSETEDRSLVLTTQPLRRYVFAGIAGVLFLAFLLAVDLERDFASENLFGTIFYFCLVGGSALIAGWDERVVFGRESESIEFRKRLFSVPVRTESVPFERVTAVVFVQTPARSETGGQEAGQETGVQGPRLFQPGRKAEYSAYIETSGERRLLEQAPDRKEIEEIAGLIAQFLEVTFIRVEQ